MNDSTKTLPGEYHQGYCYFDVNTGKFWIDTSNLASGRMAINANHADSSDAAILAAAAESDSLGNTIINYYGHSLNFSSTSGTNVLSLQDAEGLPLSSVTLGALASVNSVSGQYTPAGTNAPSAIVISPTTTAVSKLATSGSIATLSTTVTNEVLSFNFNGGAMPTFNSITVWNGYNSGASNSYAQAQTFSGSEATITLSPVTGGARNGDNLHF